MEPNSSAFLLLVEDINSERVIDDLKDVNANVITLTVGDELSGQIAQYTTSAAHDDQGNVVVGEGVIAADAEGNVVAGANVVAATTDDSTDAS